MILYLSSDLCSSDTEKKLDTALGLAITLVPDPSKCPAEDHLRAKAKMPPTRDPILTIADFENDLDVRFIPNLVHRSHERFPGSREAEGA